MSTSIVTEVKSFMNYHRETSNQFSSNDHKMAPLVEQDKNAGNGDLAAGHPDEPYTSTETNSSENNYDIQLEENSVGKPRNHPSNDGFPNVNGPVAHDEHLRLQISPEYYRFHSLFPQKNGDTSATDSNKLVFDGLYRCPKCDFVGRNDDELHEHALRHDPYECGSCGFLADTQDNIQVHLRDEHSEIPASTWDDHILFHETAESAESSPKKKCKVKPFEENIDKPRKTPCKICNNFVGNSKMEYYAHLRDVHSETGKLLHCDLCPFIALYKHHLEYHFRNHYGSKPYKCDRCDYSCVNRSMLNSHYKSHSDIYQYSCKNCSYVTKYLHSLKMHLRKYTHQPGRVLNPDGSVNGSTIIDVHGKRRGPKSKKRKSETDRVQEGRDSPKSKSSPSPPSSSFSPHHSPQNIRILYNPHIYNNYTGNLYIRPGPLEASNYMLHSPPNIGNYKFRCALCEFVTDSFEMYHYHMCSHVNQDQNENGSFKANFPFYVSPHNLNSPGFGSHFNAEPFLNNRLNQERTTGSESRNTIDHGTTFQNSTNALNNYGSLENNTTNKRESLSNGASVPPKMPIFNDQQQLKRSYRKRRENGIKSHTPFPNETLTVKEESFEDMNGIQIPLTRNPADSVPLDLSVKQPPPPETRISGNHQFQLLGGKAVTTDDRASSVGQKFANGESKLVHQKTNRRKGRAFKLNQYTIEADPISDGFETEFDKTRVLPDNSHSSETHSEPAFGSGIKKSVPRINFKTTLNPAKWNGHNYLESELQFLTPKHVSSYVPLKIEPAPEQRVRERSSDSWCSSCSMDAGNAFLLQLHSSYHTRGDPFTCAKCGLRCEDKVRFNSHIILGSRINGTCINAAVL